MAHFARYRRRPWGRRSLISVAILVLALGTAAVTRLDPSSGSGSFDLYGTVTQVADGDTLTLKPARGKTERVRLASIDAPEAGKSAEQPGQAFADQSRSYLAQLVQGKTLKLQCYERDNYQRAICDVKLEGMLTANRRMVEQGLAWANTEKKGRFLRDPEVSKLEQQARKEKRGIWADGQKPIAPWEWRYQCWQQKKC